MARTGPSGVAPATVSTTAHAKHVGDGLASEISNKMKQLLASSHAVQAGHREHVLLLAEVYKRPTVDAGNKTGMWSTSRSIVAYYSDEVLSLNSERVFKAMTGAKKNRFRVGAQRGIGALQARLARRPQGFLCVLELLRTQVRLRELPVPKPRGQSHLWVLPSGNAGEGRANCDDGDCRVRGNPQSR